LRIEHYLLLALEHAYRLGEMRVTPEVVAMTMAPDLHALEPILARYGYNVSALSEVLHIRQAEVRTGRPFMVMTCQRIEHSANPRL
jgi:hypothetical protein